MGTVPLYILTGFLGSGKTSVILSLMRQLPNRRIGIILNDFGTLGVDASLVPDSKGIIKKELSGGQIFCSCLSGTFVDTVAAYKELEIDMLIVEASGLSKPAPLMEIVSFVSKKTFGYFSYRGMLCVIDAERYLTLSQSLMTLEEQAVFSDLFIINKTDRADKITIKQVTESLRTLQPGCRIIETAHGEVPLDILDLKQESGEAKDRDLMRYQGWQSPGRPKAFVLSPVTRVPLKGLEEFIKEASASCYRIKGYALTTDDTRVYVSAVGTHVEITRVDYTPAQEGIVFLQKANGTGNRVFPSRWMLHTGTTVKVQE